MTLCRSRNDAQSLRELAKERPQLPSLATQSGTPPNKGPLRFLRIAEVIQLTGLGKTKIYELQSEGTFPMRVQITSHSVGWVEEEVQTWLSSRVAASTALRVRGDAAPIKRRLSP